MSDVKKGWKWRKSNKINKQRGDKRFSVIFGKTLDSWGWIFVFLCISFFFFVLYFQFQIHGKAEKRLYQIRKIKLIDNWFFIRWRLILILVLLYNLISMWCCCCSFEFCWISSLHNLSSTIDHLSTMNWCYLLYFYFTIRIDQNENIWTVSIVLFDGYFFKRQYCGEKFGLMEWGGWHLYFEFLCYWFFL